MDEVSRYHPSTHSSSKDEVHSPAIESQSSDVQATSRSLSASMEKAINDANGNEDDEYPSGMRLFVVIAALVLAMLPAVMDLTILATAIPHITDQFHSLDDVGWYAAVYFMTFASSQSMWGKAYKYFDLKTVFLINIAIFAIASLICGTSPLILAEAVSI